MTIEFKRRDFDAGILGFPATLIEREDARPIRMVTTERQRKWASGPKVVWVPWKVQWESLAIEREIQRLKLDSIPTRPTAWRDLTHDSDYATSQSAREHSGSDPFASCDREKLLGAVEAESEHGHGS